MYQRVSAPLSLPKPLNMAELTDAKALGEKMPVLFGSPSSIQDVSPANKRLESHFEVEA